jgi:hypothetical protein
MQAMMMQADIGADGKLLLEVTCNLPPGPAEVVVVVQPKTSAGGPPYDTLAGFLKGQVPPDLDVEAALQEMNQEWEESLELPQ